MKLCKDCKHYWGPNHYVGHYKAICVHQAPEFLGDPSPVTGARPSLESSDPLEKRQSGSCGMDAIFWEAKPVEPVSGQEPEPKGILGRSEGRPETLRERMAGWFNW